MSASFLRNPFAAFFARSKGEQHLERYVIREYRNGRSLAEILDDPYVRNRTTPAQRARLLERPDVVAAIGEHAVAELRATAAGGR